MSQVMCIKCMRIINTKNTNPKGMQCGTCFTKSIRLIKDVADALDELNAYAKSEDVFNIQNLNDLERMIKSKKCKTFNKIFGRVNPFTNFKTYQSLAVFYSNWEKDRLTAREAILINLR